MATCKDCLYFPMCKNIAIGNMTITSDACECFSDKSRFVELPCKVGDPVWCISATKIKSARVGYIEIWSGDTVVTLDINCSYECDGCPFEDHWEDPTGSGGCDGEYGQTTVSADDFGKTVFLTREEAEAALAERNKG